MPMNNGNQNALQSDLGLLCFALAHLFKGKLITLGVSEVREPCTTFVKGAEMSPRPAPQNI